MTFFQPCFWSKNGLLSNFFSLRNIGQENVFYDILDRKDAFLDYKKKNFKKAKNWHFSKGVNPWFWSKNGLFCNFFFSGNIVHENVFYDILKQKNDFLGCKKNKFKKSKFFSFRQYRPGKCFLVYSRTKKLLSRL